MKTQLLLPLGTRISCSSGHYIGRAEIDLDAGDELTRDAVEDERNSDFAARGSCLCGASWMLGVRYTRRKDGGSLYQSMRWIVGDELTSFGQTA